MREILRDSGLGLERGVVYVVRSDPGWPVTFARVASALRSALPDSAVCIEHVGSTAVPGLPAKPILDIAVGVDPTADPDPVIRALTSLGFLYRGEADGGRLDRMFGWEDSPRHRLVNLHLIVHEGPEWNAYLEFRDRLRHDDAARDRYATIKQRLAERFPRDRHAYIAGKESFVADILDP